LGDGSAIIIVLQTQTQQLVRDFNQKTPGMRQDISAFFKKWL